MPSVLFCRFRGNFNVICRTRHRMAIQGARYEETVNALNELQQVKMLTSQDKLDGLGLVVMKQFLDRVKITNKDIEEMKIVHVSGTKGKGSTCSFVESILRHSGVKTGFFSSPHLVEVRERFRINGKPISTDLFSKYFWEVYELLETTKACFEIKKPSYFYFLTVLAFYIFKHEPIEAVIMEVGVGGAYDCTNVITKPVVCGISSLGIDHVDILGDTIELIAWQKAGICKPNVPAFTVPQPEGAMPVLKQRAKEKGTEICIVPNFNKYVAESLSVPEIKLGLAGEHQKLNASLAVQLASCWLSKGLSVNSAHILSSSFVQGLSNCRWDGRAQIIKFDSITFYLDGAHTKRSLSCAAKWFNEASAQEQRELKTDCDKILAFNLTKQRNPNEMLPALLSCNFSNSIFTPNIATVLSSGSNDQKSLTQPYESCLMRVLSNRDNWIKLCAAQNPKQPIPMTMVFPTIADAVCWLSTDRDLKLHEQSLSMTTGYPDVPVGSTSRHLQILVTGSLHLVGGYLRVIKPDINTN